MNTIYTLSVVALAIACVAAQGRRGQGGAGTEFGQQSQAAAQETVKSEVAAQDNLRENQRTAINAGARDGASAAIKSGDQASVSAAERVGQQESLDAAESAGLEHQKYGADFISIDFATKDNAINKQGISILIDEGVTNEAALSANEANKFNVGGRFLENAQLSSDAIAQSQAAADANKARLDQVEAVEQQQDIVQGLDQAAKQSDFFLNAGAFGNSGLQFGSQGQGIDSFRGGFGQSFPSFGSGGFQQLGGSGFNFNGIGGSSIGGGFGLGFRRRR